MVCQDVYSHYPLPVQRIEPGQLPDALQTVLSVLLHQAQIVCQSKNAAQAKQTFQQQDSLSTSNSILRSMLLVLHVIALANYKICGQTHTVAASATLVLVFSRFMDYLGDEHVALKQTATLPDVDTALLVEVVKKVMPNLRQTVKRIPGSAVIFIDVLLKLSSLVPSVQGVAQAIIAHGEHIASC